MKPQQLGLQLTSLQTTQKELPDDLVVEILARLPVKSLLRFRSVSKHWYSLIVSPNFIALHSTHSQRKKKVPLLYYSCKRNRYRNTVSFGFGDDTKRLTFGDYIANVHIVGCSNGVVCLSLWPQPEKYVLWNPATRQVRVIGNPEGRPLIDFASPYPYKSSSGIFLDPVTNAIKVVDIILGAKGENRALVNVFSTATNSWTEKENITVPYPIWLSGCHTSIIDTICVDGYMLWQIAIARRKPGPTRALESADMYILSYDMNVEVFKRIEIPFRPSPTRLVYHLASYGGSLAVFVREITGSNVDVWVLKDCSGANQSWSKLLTCRPSFKDALIVGFFRKDNVDLILFRKYLDLSLQLYDPESGETKEFGKRGCALHTFLYNEGIASLDQPEIADLKKNEKERAKPEEGNSIENGGFGQMRLVFPGFEPSVA